MKPLKFVLTLIFIVKIQLLTLTGQSATGLPLFATYMASYDQERKAEALIKSIRLNAGKLKNARILVFIDKNYEYTGLRLDSLDITVIPIEINSKLPELPYLIKAYAAAQAETIAEESSECLLWFDPETFVSSEPGNLLLHAKKQIALRPVFLTNSIAIHTGKNFDFFWKKIFEQAKLDTSKVFRVKSVVDNKDIFAYFNCGIMSVNPAKKIFRKWAELQSALLTDIGFVKEAFNDNLHRIFFHQAVFTAAVLTSVKKEDIQWLPLSCAYPLNLQDKIPEKKRFTKFNQANTYIFEDVWNTNNNWFNILEMDQAKKSSVLEIYSGFFCVTKNIYRLENDCNTYLFKTSSGNVLVDPGGASAKNNPLMQIHGNSKLNAILLTHAHADHRGGINLWKTNDSIPIIAHIECIEFLKYHDRLAKFYFRRNAYFTGNPYNKDTVISIKTPIDPTIFINQNYSFKSGDTEFKMIPVGGETPDQCLIWIPQLKTVCIGDNYFGAFPNLATPRGTKPRWALDYIKALDSALKFQPEVLLPGHQEPVLGKENIQKKLKKYRDAIQYVHDQTVKGINEGTDVFTLMNTIKLPANLQLPEYYGNVKWAVRGIYENYTGWFDEKTSSFYGLSPDLVNDEWIDLAGGIEKIKLKTSGFFAKKEFVKVLYFTEVILQQFPDDKPTIKIRIETLKELFSKSENYFEQNWIKNEIKRLEKL